MRFEANVGGMDCPSCVAKIERVVGGLDDVESLQVDLTFGRLRAEVTSEAAVSNITDSVRKLGYSIVETSRASPRAAAERPSIWEDRRLGAVMLGLVSTVGAVIARYGFELEAPAIALYLIAIALGGFYVFRNAATSLRHKHLDINVLMTIAVVGAIALGEWFEAATVVVLFAFAEWLEGMSMERARRAIRDLMELEPATARVLREREERHVDIDEVRVGEEVRVLPGERIPLDGTVIRGTSAVDQSAITGESIPVTKSAGDDVFAGSLNDRGHLVLEVTAPASESTIAHVLRAIEEARANRSESERFIERFTRWYTPAVVVGAALVALVPPLLFGGDGSEWFYRALVLLVIACPCALVIATPITTVSALARAARDGVLVKGGRYLESLDRLKAVVFDKTGTLTRGRLVVDAVHAHAAGEDELLSLAAVVEQRSEHYLARAIVREAAERELDLSDASEFEFQAHPGEGVEARFGLAQGAGDCCSSSCAGESAAGSVEAEHIVLVGARRLFERNGIDLSGVASAWDRLESGGSTVVGVSRDGEMLGLIACSDQVRSQAKATIARLHELGVERIAVCTGDNETAAAALANQIGLPRDAVYANLMPQGKVDVLRRIASETDGTVAMVGDGINDAPALAAADVGIAMGAAGTDVALETAHVALMGDELERLGDTVELGRSTVRIIRQNVVLALGIKAAVLGLAIAGWATIWMAIAADMGTSLLVIANGMRLLRRDQEKSTSVPATMSQTVPRP